MRKFILALGVLVLCGHSIDNQSRHVTASILADASLLAELGIPVLGLDQEQKVGYAEINPLQQYRLSRLAHMKGRCGGFEVLDPRSANPKLALTQLNAMQLSSQAVTMSVAIPARAEILDAVGKVSEASVQSTIEFLSGFHDRYYRGNGANEAITEFKKKIEALPNAANLQIELINHTRITQKSLRVRIVGSKYPDEIVALGAHADSVNWQSFSGAAAPGFDDNASGSADVFEALRIVSEGPQPERTLEFYWYAGEEGGLLGSAEIAQQYKNQNKKVVGVMQLDMTSYAGSGEGTISTITDFTNANLRNYLEQLNNHYVQAKILEDKCGYGCSDHASWHRQGFATVMPFEAMTGVMNPKIHTSEDTRLSKTSFKHAALFAKLAIAFTMDLGNSRFVP